MASILEELASKFMSMGLDAMLAKANQDPAVVADDLALGGAILTDLSVKERDGKITPDEIQDTLSKLEAHGNDPIILAVKAFISRLMENRLGGK